MALTLWAKATMCVLYAWNTPYHLVSDLSDRLKIYSQLCQLCQKQRNLHNHPMR